MFCVHDEFDTASKRKNSSIHVHKVSVSNLRLGIMAVHSSNSTTPSNWGVGGYVFVTENEEPAISRLVDSNYCRLCEYWLAYERDVPLALEEPSI